MIKYELGNYKPDNFDHKTNAFFNIVNGAFPKEENSTPHVHGVIVSHFLNSNSDRMGICASRGIGKSRIVGNYMPIILPMLGIGLGKRKNKGHKFIVLISATFDNAVDMIQEIKDLYESMDDRYKKLIEIGIWKADEISFKVQDGTTLSIVAMGAEGKIRGIRRRGNRPDLLIFDDSEFEELVYNPQRMIKWKKWVTRSAIPAMTPDGVVVWIGTPLPNSLLGEIQSNSNWDFIECPIQDEFGTPAWVDRFPHSWIERKKQEFKEMGEINAWYQEYELEIIAESEQIFKPDMMRYISVSDIPTDLEFYVTCDLAISSATSADRTSFVVSAVDVDNNIYVFEIYADRSSPSRQVGELLSIASRYYEKNNNSPVYIGMEKGALKHSFIDQWERRLLDIDYNHKIPKIQDLDPYGGANSKNKRIQQLETLFYRKKVFFVRGCKNIDILEEELLSFPASKHDDVSDAFSYLLQIVRWREKQDEEIRTFGDDSIIGGVCW